MRSRSKNVERRTARQDFRRMLAREMRANPALAMLAIETYAAYKHRRHIHQIWAMLGDKHRAVWDEYSKTVMSTHLTGESNIFKSLHFAESPAYEFRCRIPERIALGDALACAYAVLNRKKAAAAIKETAEIQTAEIQTAENPGNRRLLKPIF